MSQCLNPECLSINPDNFKFCQKCGNKLLLVERYWAKSILGQGGFGRTFLAVDEFKPSKPFCVIKQFLPQAQGTETVAKAAELFAQEAERLELLGKHSQIPELFAYFSVDSRQYLVQEFIQGETLQQELDSHGVFNESQIRELLIDLLSVLQFVHSHNVIHRDIKPENIIRREADKKLVVVDFGASKIMPKTQRRTVAGTVIGSAEYCAPEQSMGKANSGSDLYSLGITCLYLLTQKNPLDLYDVMEMEWVWRDCLNGNFVSDELGEVLDGLVEQKPKLRYQKVEDVLADLGLGNYSVSVTPKINKYAKIKNPPPPPPKIKKSPKTSASPPQKNQQPRQNFASNDVPLVSARGVNYENLRDLLAAGKWKEADQETTNCMLKVTKREKEGWLRKEDIDNFPCEDLRTINQLWVKYSNGKFGFSVQKQIYQSMGGTRQYDRKIWEAFGDRVGWRKGGKWLLSYSDLTLGMDTNCKGCLPVEYFLIYDRVSFWESGKMEWHWAWNEEGRWTERWEREGGVVRTVFSRAKTCRLSTQKIKKSPKTSVSPAPKIQQPRQNFVSNDVPLVSARGVNYKNLRDLLAAGKWKEADQETERCMLKVARREKEGWLDNKSIDNFPCEDLRTIDQLWLKCSNGKFGFSVQKQIYQSLGGTMKYDRKVWEAFGDRVGWRQGGSWLSYSDLTLSLDTHYTGKLPLVARVAGFGSMVGGTLLSRRDL